MMKVRLDSVFRNAGFRSLAFVCFAAALSGISAIRGNSPAEAQGLEFFERRIRPLLVERCLECHSAEKQKGGLRLDSKARVLKGGDSGPAVVLRNPDASLLMKAVRYDNPDLQMPPKNKLAPQEIDYLAEWIRMGAPDPRLEDAQPSNTRPPSDGADHWAYQPLRKPWLPEVADARWPVNEIDHFILARLESEGLRPVRDAGKAALVRRVYFDLIGLPPTPAQIDAFLKDAGPEAFARLVDRLLASPHFGERWGRHWLDVARFGESVTLRGLIFREAWRYRDYVIDAFNNDLPFDQFILEQVAGDLMHGASRDEHRRRLIATTFLALGNTVLEEQDKVQLRMDVVDEQLDTIGKAFLGQTIGCARCHDHKFDPISTREYYAMAGILRSTQTLIDANVSNWIERALPVRPELEAALAAHEAEVGALQAQIKTAKDRLAKLNAELTGHSSGPDIIAASKLAGIVVDDLQAKQVGEWQFSQYFKRFIGDGYLHDLDRGKGEKTLTFHPELPKAGRYEVRLAYSPGSNRSPSVPVTILSADGETIIHVNQREQPPLEGRFVSLGQFRFEANNQGYVLISNEGTAGHVIADAVQFLPVEATGALAAGTKSRSLSPKPGAAESTDDKSISLTASGTARELLANASDEVKRLESELKKLVSDGPVRPMVMSVKEAADLGDTYVHIRGSVHNRGEVVPRGFLKVATHGTAPGLPSDASGRLELGEWLSSPDNPLTARVFVNRAWHWLFGAGLVRTTDNFGATGETPSHPELLDYLAVRFMEEGWSVKWLLREMVLSRTYRLSSAIESEPLHDGSKLSQAELDPENRWLWRANRRRLEAECIRDAILFVSGQLNLERSGSTIPAGVSADYGLKYDGTLRSVYVPMLRNSIPEIFQVFDVADPSMVTGVRTSSTVAPQALYLMNHPFVLEQARASARRLLEEPSLSQSERVERVYRLALGRLPTPGELRVAADHLNQMLLESSAEEKAWAQLFQAIFASLDFRYLN